MSEVVLDASAALAWCFPDEGSGYADRVLAALEGRAIIVPAIWSLEIANAILAGERRKRLGSADAMRFVALLESIPVTADSLAVGDCVGRILPLSRQYALSAYDAAYLELAIRRAAPLATLDERLAASARQARVALFERAAV